MAQTERGKYRFTVKESANGEPWIMLEPLGETLPLLKNGFISFDLRAGITLDDAQKLTQELNKEITGVSVTRF